jgi:hypothetical protein
MSAQANPLAPIEAAQKILAAADAPLDRLEAARLDLQRVIAAGEADLEASAARRKIELSAAVPVAELSKKLASLDANDIEIRRRLEIAGAVISQIEPRIADAREHEAERLRRVRYDAALALHAQTTSLIQAFLTNTAPAARAALQAYVESEAAVAAVNKDLPAGASPIKSLEDERRGELQTRETVVRRLRYFYRGADRIVECERAEAIPTGPETWNVYVPSNSTQGGETFGGCHIREFVEVRIETLKSQPESLMTGLRIPQFHEPYVTAGTSRRAVPAAEWDAANGQPVPRLAAE